MLEYHVSSVCSVCALRHISTFESFSIFKFYIDNLHSRDAVAQKLFQYNILFRVLTACDIFNAIVEHHWHDIVLTFFGNTYFHFGAQRTRSFLNAKEQNVVDGWMDRDGIWCIWVWHLLPSWRYFLEWFFFTNKKLFFFYILHRAKGYSSVHSKMLITSIQFKAKAN